MVNPLVVEAGGAAAAKVMETIGTFALNMMKLNEEKREREERREQEKEERRRELEREERRERQEQRDDQERHAADWKREIKKGQEELDRERQDRIEAGQLHAKMQAQREVEHEAAMKRQAEVLERERRDRMEAERKADHSREYVMNCIKIFSQMMRQQQHPQSESRCRTDRAKTFEYSSEQESSEKHSAAYIVELPNDFADGKELLNVFNASLQQGSGTNSPNASQSSQLLEFLEQPPTDFEDTIYSMVLATINGVTVDEAKEEGNAYFKDQKFNEAIKCYTKSIDQAPTAIVYANRAMAYLKINRSFKAEEDCTEALKIDRYYFKAYARRATARTNLGRLEEALEDVDSALQLEPMHQELDDLRAELKCLLLKAPTSGRACDIKEKANQAKEEGNSYFKDRKFNEAIKCYSESIDMLPTGASYADRAEAYLELNKYAEAEEDCTEALKLDGGDFKLYARRAMARRSLKHDLMGALTDTGSALDLEPADLEMKKLRAEIMNLIY